MKSDIQLTCKKSGYRYINNTLMRVIIPGKSYKCKLLYDREYCIKVSPLNDGIIYKYQFNIDEYFITKDEERDKKLSQLLD